MSQDNFDVVVIGGGPGGYVAAIRAAQLGLSVACIEKRQTLGGTCLNVGCIPSKALLQSSHHFELAHHQFKDHGIKIQSLELDLPTMMGRKDKVVLDNTKGIDFLFKKNKVTRLVGIGRVLGTGKVSLSTREGVKEIKARHIIIATGSEVTPLNGVEIDENQVVSSTGALSLSKVPNHLIVVGGGVIGLELGSVWKRLGSQVTVVEYLDYILPQHDREISTQAQKIFEKQGIVFKLGMKVLSAKKSNTKISLALEPAKGGEQVTLEADTILVAIGRRPYSDGLGLKEAGITVDKRGFIQVDKHFQTNISGVYAIGDVIGGAMLAHKAEEEGVALAELLAGQAGHVNYDTIPGIVYTWPEIANVGKSEEELKSSGVSYKVGKFPFSANGRARGNGDSDGFVKILADSKTDRVLGCHIVGPSAGDLIAEIVVAMEYAAASEDIARICHAHPTLSEAVKEAALAVEGRTIHL
jgi:dihydrolipoamide dehydrogenase